MNGERSSKLVVLEPVLIAWDDSARSLATRPLSLNGLRVGFLWNNRAGGEPILAAVAGQMNAKYQLAGEMHRTKSFFGEPAPAAMLDELSTSCDVVVTALGD